MISLFDRQGNYKDLNFVLHLFVKRFIYVAEETTFTWVLLNW